MTDAMTLQTLLSHGRSASSIVAWRKNTPLNFAEFSALASRWHGAFLANEAVNIALYCDDSFNFSAALFGAWHAGKCIYLPGDRLPATLMRLSAITDSFAGDLPNGLSALPEHSTHHASWQPLDVSREQLVIYTSGSTGEPLPIPKRLSQLFTEVNSLTQCFDTGPNSGIVQATVSHQHIYGLLFHILWPLASARAFAATALPFPEDIIQAFLHSPGILITSPAHLKRLPPSLPWAECRHQLHAIFSSGGPLPESALNDCVQWLGQAPIEVFGSSETGGIAWRQRSHAAANFWLPLPEVDLRVADGFLHVKSAHNYDADWFDTGTWAELDYQGLVLHGRKDRIVKIEEKRISLTAMERVLAATDLLSEAHIVVLDKPPRLTLGVVALPSAAGWLLHESEGKLALNTALRNVLAEHVEAVALPRSWRYVHSLPIDSRGKLTEAALVNCFDARRAPARIQSHSSHQAIILLDIHADSPHFDGHFPELPVLPGVTQVDWAMQLGHELFTLPAVFLRLDNVKFQHVIQPNSLITLELNYDSVRATLAFRFTSPFGTHASGRAVFGHAS